MTAKFKANDQVSVRTEMRSNMKLIRVGIVVSANSKTATVLLQKDRIKRVFNVEDLELISKRYTGRTMVNANPSLRGRRV